MADDDDDIDSDLAKLAVQMQTVARDPREWAKAVRQGDQSALRELQDVAGGDVGFLDKIAEETERAADNIGPPMTEAEKAEKAVIQLSIENAALRNLLAQVMEFMKVQAELLPEEIRESARKGVSGLCARINATLET